MPSKLDFYILKVLYETFDHNRFNYVDIPRELNISFGDLVRLGSYGLIKELIIFIKVKKVLKPVTIGWRLRHADIE